MEVYAVDLIGDFDMPYTAFIGDDIKAKAYIDKLPKDAFFRLFLCKWNSTNRKRITYERNPYTHALDNHKALAEQAFAANLWIDGTAPDDTYQGDATQGPWVVFDIAAQTNIAGPFIDAQEARNALLNTLNERN